MRSILLGCVLLAMTTRSAMADAVSDATAGQDALKRGDAKAAIGLFSRAIASQSLSQNDLEYAYVERGNAYLQNNEPDHARRDADKALSLNPTDQDAKLLWKQTTIEARPGPSRESPDPMAASFSCVSEKAPADPPIMFDLNFEKKWVKSLNFGEKGRKIDIETKESEVYWHFHLEMNNKDDYFDQYFTLDRSKFFLKIKYLTSTNNFSFRYFICH